MVWNHIEVEPALPCGITEQMFSYILPSSPYSFWRVPRTSLNFLGKYLVPYRHFITFTELDSSPSIWIFPLPQIYVHPTKTVFSALIIWYRFIWNIFLSDHPSMIFIFVRGPHANTGMALAHHSDCIMGGLLIPSPFIHNRQPQPPINLYECQNQFKT